VIASLNGCSGGSPLTTAASIVGDLRETASSRSVAWFWWSVLGTAGALVWRGTIADPVRMFSLAFRWTLVIEALEIAGVGFMPLVGDIAININIASMEAKWVVKATVWVAVAAYLLLTVCRGPHDRRRAPGRELSACLALVITQWVVGFAVAVVLAVIRGNGAAWGPQDWLARATPDWM
jgi:hypothetical protein